MNVISRLLYSPLNVQIVVTRRCNLACKYCNEFNKTSQPVSKEILFKRIEKIIGLGAFSLTFTGGEPLLHPSLVDVLAYAKQGRIRVNMITNGFLLTKEKIQKLNSVKLHALQLSIDGLHPNENTVKVWDNLQEKLTLLKQYAHFTVNINAVIGSTIPTDVEELIQRVTQPGFATSIGLIHDHQAQLTLSKEEAQLYVKLNSMRKKPFWDSGRDTEHLILKGRAPFKCRAGARYLYVDEDGIVHWCSQMRDQFKKALETYTLTDLKKQFYTHKDCHSTCTIGCVRSSSMLDHWRKQ